MRDTAGTESRLGRLEALMRQQSSSSSAISAITYWHVRDCTGLTLTPGTDWDAVFTAAGTYTDSRLATAGGEIKDPRASVSYQIRYKIKVNSRSARSITCYLGEPGSASSNAQINVNGSRTDTTSGSSVTISLSAGSNTIAVMIDGDGDRGWLNALLFDGDTSTWEPL